MSLTLASLGPWLPGGAATRPHGAAMRSTGWVMPLRDIELLVAIAVLSRLIIVLAFVLAYAANPARMEGGPDDIFCNWDCSWYIDIAEKGYWLVTDADKHGVANWAFFPLLPAAIAGVTAATGLPAAYAGLVVANVAWCLGLYFIYLLARDYGGSPFARYVSLLYGFWPFGVHASVPMTEAVFVPLSIGLFLFARRGGWLMALPLAAALSASRTVGVLTVIPLFVLASREYGLWRVIFIRPGTERAVLALAASGLGLALYMLHLNGLMGDALAFAHNQNAWNRQFKWPWMMLLDELNPAYVSGPWLIANACNAATALAAFALLPPLWQRGLKPEAIFAGLALAAAFLTGTTNSLPRYSGGLFPFILAVALLTDRPLGRTPTLVLSLAGLAIFAFAWAMEQFYVM
ncbi:MAG: hypothetical protein P4L82_19435 [Ancalomicrobiaceae bacterium]|nr:hypothetical protein [Ancalomicrobiaceae bacterium]